MPSGNGNEKKLRMIEKGQTVSEVQQGGRGESKRDSSGEEGRKWPSRIKWKTFFFVCLFG